MLAPKEYERWMETALRLAEEAAARGDVPVGALVLDRKGTVIGKGFNQREDAPFDPTAHAEIVALRQAAAHRGSWRLDGCTLVVTLEPCSMCAGAIVHARISRLVFGAWDDKAGACGSVRDIVRDPRLNHSVEVVGGVCDRAARTQLQQFFSSRR